MSPLFDTSLESYLWREDYKDKGISKLDVRDLASAGTNADPDLHFQ